MPRFVKLALAAGACLTASLALAAGAGANAKLTADYRFENDLKSSAGNAPRLTETGAGGTFEDELIDGSNDGVWDWTAGDGLRLKDANKVMGSKGKAYTFLLLVNLDTVSSYRKLVDFANLNKDKGWYVYEESLYPYDIEAFDYSEQLIQAGTWRQIALTRSANGKLSGYVGDKRIDSVKDGNKQEVLGHDKILHFLQDDSNIGESTGGQIARLRIWDDALPGDKIKQLAN
jgi:hypothetical protein